MAHAEHRLDSSPWSRSASRVLRLAATLVFLTFLLPTTAAEAQNRLSVSTAVLDAAGGQVNTGANFRYRVSYSCDLVSIPSCDSATVTVDLPPEVAFVSAFFPPGDVATAMHDGSPTGGTVTFTFMASVPAGNTGDLDLTVRFPNGSTPDGTITTGLSLAVGSSGTGLVPQTADLPPVSANASPQVDLDVNLSGAFVDDCPSGSEYQVTVGPSTSNGSLNLVDGTVTLLLPTGVTGVTPLDGGIYDMPSNTVTWTGLGSIAVGNTVTLRVGVTFASPTFSDGQTVTSTATALVDPLNEPPGFTEGPTDFDHTLQQFTEVPDASVTKRFGEGRPGGLPPAEGQAFSYLVRIRNTGNIALDTLSVIDDGDGALADIDPGIEITSVSTGAYNPAPTSVTINVTGDMGSTPSVTSVNGSTDTLLDLTGGLLMPGERAIRIEWVFNGGAPVGMSPSTAAEVSAMVNVGSTAGTAIDNHATASWTATLTGLCGGPAGPASGTATDDRPLSVNDPYAYLRPAKNETTSGPYFPGDTVGFSFDLRNDALANDAASGVVVTDLLPEFLAFDAGSATFSDNGTGVSLAMPLEVIDNYNNTGRTLLRWTLAGDLDPGETVNISFDTTVVLGVIFGSLTNQMGMSFDSPPVQQNCAGSSAVDSADLDGDSDTTDTLCTATENIQIAAVAQLASRKFVRGQCNSSGPGFVPGLGTDDSVPGGIVDWRVEVQNVQTVPMRNFVIVDILPFVGDTGVRDLTPRLSLFQPLLIEPITPPPGGTVFYSLSGNPCRPEVGGPTSGCDNPNWTPIPPSPITDARSIKVEFGDRVLNPLDTLQFEWRMILPADVPTDGSEAFNSFAFGSNRSDDGGFLGAEPNKVGIDATCFPVPPNDAMLGDFVWLDGNGNGTQDPGETGVNNVPVQLFDPGPDGLPRTGDDLLVLSTITADDALGNPGWYKFSALAPGDYYVQFTPPLNFSVTIQDVPGDESIDSDADPQSACTDVISLAPSENNPDIDMGLLSPATASLGNYVWFDRDGDGIQDQALTDGVNGVAVKLYVDDGDGVPEPNGDDGAPLQTTVTADDAFGNPGFYLFENLVPGTPYFVQFMLPPTADGFTARNQGGDDTVDSDANLGNGTTPVVTLAPGEHNPTLDAGLDPRDGNLGLGNVVWMDEDGNGVIDAAGDDDGLYDPLVPEMAVNGVRLNLYLDDNNDGQAQTNEYFGSTVTQTVSGKDGRYRFDDLPAGDYIVEVDASAFAPGAPLAGKVSSSLAGVDPDNDQDSDDNGNVLATVVLSLPVTLSNGGEPTPDADDDLKADDDLNFTVDFGFIPGVRQDLDYGDNPDVGTGTAQGNYNTVTLDNGARHPLPGPMGPYLGSCVDSDNGQLQNVTATADDLAGATTVTYGVCASAGDDEDGVSFSSGLLMVGGTVDVTVSSSSAVPCVVSGWIDWNQDGSFDNFPPEKILTDAAAGAFPGISIPAAAVPGFTHARFRCSTAGGDGPVGPAVDGEVEDYRLQIMGVDLGDAPDAPYGTLIASGGPVHDTDPNVELYLGQCVDTETDGQPNAAADGDDVNLGTSRIGDCIDDEDGVVFDTMLVRGQMAQITVTASMPGRLDAWIDFDGLGGFAGGDQIAANVGLAAGANPINFFVPANAAVGTTYARFRFSTAGSLAPGGMAADGEVEDYAVVIKGFDFGDAPEPVYPTTLASAGAQHIVDPASSLFLGSCVDPEDDGQPSATADGDDLGAANSASGSAGSCAGNDDEDGVSFGMLLACATAQITVNANAPGRLDAWIDFDGTGGFSGGLDQIASNMALAAGSTVLNVPVPCTAILGTTYARFRFSSAGGLTAGGLAMDGEVEDYAVTVKGVDFGDAPDSHGTTFASGGPFHGVDPVAPIFLGSCVDTETGAFDNAGATGDDNTIGTSTQGTCAVANDDEDGVTFDTMLAACESASLTVVASAAGLLDAWIDFDGDGTFTAASDRIFNGQAVAAGANALSFTVPCTASAGNRAARFRYSSTGVATSGGVAMDGEVEDYLVLVKGTDFGDAPDTYDTELASGGPRHTLDPAANLFFGTCVDSESDGQATVGADGDDLAAGSSVLGVCTSMDDEDGVVFDTPITACKAVDLTISASAAALVDAWIDFDGDGTFTGSGEQVFASEPVVAGANARSFFAPCDAAGGSTYARFRISSVGGLGIGGPAGDGEIEDYLLSANASDFGDAPDTYGTSEAAGGASHGVVIGSNLFLGSCVDTEDDSAGSVGADNDDLASGGVTEGTCTVTGDDEDGVVFDTMLIACQQTTVTVTSSAAAVLDAWIDYDLSGTFDPGTDRIANGMPLVAGSNELTLDVPCVATPGDTYARFRLSSAGVAGPTGTAADGEVEDYAVLLKGSDLGDAPASYGTLLADDGARHGVDPAGNLFLGQCVDTESEGQPSSGDDGDDLATGTGEVGTCATAGDDEDGVVFDTMVVACNDTDLTVTASQGGVLDAWLDFDGNGTFDVAEKVFDGTVLTAGSNALTFAVPCDAEPGDTHARFRFTSTGVALPTGPAMDGEVEDHPVLLKGLDFADAPDSYDTELASGGPRHTLDPASGLFLGSCVDSEADGQASAGADGDDVATGSSVLGTCSGADDEDGVTFDTPVTACKTVDLTIVASTSGMVDAWIDFDGDGTFAGSGEQIFSNEAVAAGSNSRNFFAPCDAAGGPTYVRFRISSAGGLGIGGAADDGEVEDYLLTSSESDFGDAPDSYGTSEAAGGASHGVIPGSNLFLGSCVDTEDDSAGSVGADNDDLTTGTLTEGTCAQPGDDEDGVVFDTMLVTCERATITVTSAAAAVLDAWIDFGIDGSFGPATDQVVTGMALSAGANVLSFDVPCDATRGNTYARFRLSSSGVAGPTGTAGDGEVEDYAILLVGSDLGDAPASYATLLADDGPRHGVDPAGNLFLGQCVDLEGDGQPSAAADGDDLAIGTSEVGTCVQPGDDEDGVTFDSMIVACMDTDLTLTASQGGVLDAWVDFDGSGTFDADEKIFDGTVLAAGANPLSFAVPCTAVPGDTQSRFRFSSSGVALPTGLAMDGEIEDHPLLLKGLDFGDAPDPTYPVLLASGGAHHVVQPVDNPTLGSTVDTEPDGQPDANHAGDDQNGDDEDGVVFAGVLVPGTDATVQLTGGSTGGLVSLWIDLDLDGQWQHPQEQVITDLALAAGEVLDISFPVPITTAEGASCARVRIDSAGGLSPTGLAMDGEVEDYPVALGVENPEIGIAKELIDLSPETDGTDGIFLLTFALNLENLGNVALSEVNAEVDLVLAFAAAAGFSVTSLTSSELLVNPAFDGEADTSLLSPGNSLGIGERGMVELVIRLDTGFNGGPYLCSSDATGTSPSGMVVTDTSQNGPDPDPDDDGTAGNNNEPTVVEIDINILAIPTLDVVGLMVLIGCLGLLALRRLRH